MVVVHGIGHDKWSIPKGHIDAEDKTVLSAAIREVKEETGIVLPSQKYSYFDLLSCRCYLVKLTKLVELKPCSPEEVDQVAFITLGDRFSTANRYITCINLLTRSLVYWFYRGTLSLPEWVPSQELFHPEFGEMIKHAIEHNKRKTTSKNLPHKHCQIRSPEIE